MTIPPPRKGSAVLITGASSGIGREIARQFYARGHNLVLVARRTERLNELATHLGPGNGRRVECLPCDVADIDSRTKLYDFVDGLSLDIDVLALSAGFGLSGPFLEQDPDRLIQLARTNFEAHLALSRHYIPPMVDRRSGGLLVVSSMAGYQPWPNFGAYAASKAAATSFALMLGEELRGTGVTVTALTPGGVDTEFTAIAGMKKQEQTSKLAIMSRPEDIAKAGLDGLDAGRMTVTPTWQARAFVAAGRIVPRRFWLPVCEWLMA